MKHYVYVTKNEASPIKNNLIELINLVQDEIREYFTLTYEFIGSAKRNMITCDYSSNVGFDFDVNIRVNDEKENYTAKEIKNILKNGFNNFTRYFNYDFAEDSKRVLTIKVKDIENSRILHSCDFAVVYDKNDGKQQYIHFNKNQKTYEWQYQPIGFYKLEEKVNYIKKIGKWKEVRDLYLESKNTNLDLNKKSRSIFAETVNTIYNRNLNMIENKNYILNF